MAILSKIFGDANKRTIQKLEPLVVNINELESKFERFSLQELKDKTAEFKTKIASGVGLDEILPEAFAAVREATKRTLNQRHFDVQLMGGTILHQGKISEMQTGEGKTLVATLPAYLNALSGNGVHIVTVNDYLSRRDAIWMGQIYNALGLTVGCLNHEASYVYDEKHKLPRGSDLQRDEVGGFRVIHEYLKPVSRRDAYQTDITYGTNNEFGFDYLRDNMAYDQSQVVQAKGHNYAIVDEVDSILIDEARTPLIISAPDAESTKLYETFAKIAPRLKENDDYAVDEKLKAVSITEKGIEKVEQALNIKNIYNEGGTRYVHHLEQALKAQVIFHRDHDYVVKPARPDDSGRSGGDGEIIIVDEFTGRLMPGRRWSEGLHQAIEAKEGVAVQKESRTLATITFQNYFRLYKKLAGMTGTAQTSAEEFHKVYNIDVVSIPTNKPMIRRDLPDRIYKTESGKLKAIVNEVKERHQLGQPVLIGTVSIVKNEILSKHLESEGIPHKVLNAKNHEQEAEIIAQAGKFGGVTVATNMAGRGVDIILGGNPPDQEGAKKVKDVGGLHVIGTERHDARRIDNQLRGRSGRQGDQGSSQFFVSTDDELIRIFGGDSLRSIMDRLGVGEDDVIENRLISRAIEQAQTKVEGNNFDIRKYVLEYDDVMNRHRQAIYALRNEALYNSDVKERIIAYLGQVIDKIIGANAASSARHEWNLEEISEAIKAMVPIGDEVHSKLIEIADSGNIDDISKFLNDLTKEVMAAKEKEFGAQAMRNLEHMLMLRVIDELWVDHLEEMEYLRDSVRLRAYGQRDPLVEYKIEGQKLFNRLQENIAAQVANLIFKVSMVRADERQNMEMKRPDVITATPESVISSDMVRETQRETRGVTVKNDQKIGRNDPCFCGSGKKYKKCHGR